MIKDQVFMLFSCCVHLAGLGMLGYSHVWTFLLVVFVLLLLACNGPVCAFVSPSTCVEHACSWKEMYTTADGGGREPPARMRAKQMLDYDQTETEAMDRGRDTRCATRPCYYTLGK